MAYSAMEQVNSTGILHRILAFGRGYMFKKPDPKSQSGQEHAALACDLERLALAAPHLLPDLGFAEDRFAASPQRRIWRRGDVTVTIHATDDQPLIRVDMACP